MILKKKKITMFFKLTGGRLRKKKITIIRMQVIAHYSSVKSTHFFLNAFIITRLKRRSKAEIKQNKEHSGKKSNLFTR